MICPVEIAGDMSAFRAVRIRDHAKHGFLLEGRDGAGNESTGSNLAGDGKTDHVVAGSGDQWVLATGTCVAGASATRSSAMTGCSIDGGGSRLPSESPWPWWNRFWDSTGRSISIGTCGIFMRSCAPSTRLNSATPG